MASVKWVAIAATKVIALVRLACVRLAIAALVQRPPHAAPANSLAPQANAMSLCSAAGRVAIADSAPNDQPLW